MDEILIWIAGVGVEISGYYGFILILWFLQLVAFVAGCVGVLSVRGMGGRLTGLTYGGITIVLALPLPLVFWQGNLGLSWWHIPIAVNVGLGLAAICYGFSNPASPERRHRRSVP